MIGDEAFEPGVLGFEFFEASGVDHIHATESFFSVVKSLDRDADLARKLFGRLTCLEFFDGSYNLVVSESFLHLVLLLRRFAGVLAHHDSRYKTYSLRGEPPVAPICAASFEASVVLPLAGSPEKIKSVPSLPKLPHQSFYLG